MQTNNFIDEIVTPKETDKETNKKPILIKILNSSKPQRQKESD
jgi:hypothetical protein